MCPDYDLLDDLDEDLMVLEPRWAYNKAIIGVSMDGRAVYSVDKVVDACMEVSGMPRDLAYEFCEFNMFYAGGDGMPIFVREQTLFQGSA